MSTTPGTDVVAAPDMARGAVTVASLPDRIRYAEVLSHAGLVPISYQDKPANVLYAVETGTMLGIHPIAAINGINVIQGKPTISPALMTALVRRAGHKCRVSMSGTVGGGDIVATAEVIRADDPTFTYRASWDIDRAKRAGLWGGRGAWSNYPEAMLKARAIGEVCREAAEDALCGVHYVPEELGATVDVEGQVVENQPPQHRQQQTQQQAPPPEPLDADALRDALLTAPSRASLRVALIGLGAIVVVDGRDSWQNHRLAATQLADAQGEPTDGLALARTVAAGLPAEDPAPASAADDAVAEAEFMDEEKQTW